VGALLGEEVLLVGHDLPVGVQQPGGIVPLTLFWQAAGMVGQDYNVFVHLLGADGRIVAQNDGAPAGGSQPTGGWQAGDQIIDRRGVLLPDALPAGKYDLRLGMYAPAAGERLPIRDASGEFLGDSLHLGTIVVESP
jgi:hypothetical protein